MAKKDLKTQMVVAAPLSATLSGTTPQSTPWVDTQDCESVTFLVSTGTITDAGDATGIRAEVQHSDLITAASAVAVDNSDLVGLETDLTITLDTADNVPIGSIGYVGSRRYTRLVLTGSTGTAGVVNVVAVKSHLKVAAPASPVQANIAAT